MRAREVNSKYCLRNTCWNELCCYVVVLSCTVWISLLVWYRGLVKNANLSETTTSWNAQWWSGLVGAYWRRFHLSFICSFLFDLFIFYIYPQLLNAAKYSGNQGLQSVSCYFYGFRRGSIKAIMDAVAKTSPSVAPTEPQVATSLINGIQAYVLSNGGKENNQFYFSLIDPVQVTGRRSPNLNRLLIFVVNCKAISISRTHQLRPLMNEMRNQMTSRNSFIHERALNTGTVTLGVHRCSGLYRYVSVDHTVNSVHLERIVVCLPYKSTCLITSENELVQTDWARH